MDILLTNRVETSKQASQKYCITILSLSYNKKYRVHFQIKIKDSCEVTLKICQWHKEDIDDRKIIL